MTTLAFRHEWFLCCLAAWWNAWMDFWADFADAHDPAWKRDQRAQEREQLDAYLVDRSGMGNFEGAGTGGHD